jgi:hypothetical protein
LRLQLKCLLGRWALKTLEKTNPFFCNSVDGYMPNTGRHNIATFSMKRTSWARGFLNHPSCRLDFKSRSGHAFMQSSINNGLKFTLMSGYSPRFHRFAAEMSVGVPSCNTSP